MEDQARLYELSKATRGEEVELTIWGKRVRVFLSPQEDRRSVEHHKRNYEVRDGK